MPEATQERQNPLLTTKHIIQALGEVGVSQDLIYAILQKAGELQADEKWRRAATNMIEAALRVKGGNEHGLPGWYDELEESAAEILLLSADKEIPYESTDDLIWRTAASTYVFLASDSPHSIDQVLIAESDIDEASVVRQFREALVGSLPYTLLELTNDRITSLESIEDVIPRLPASTKNALWAKVVQNPMDELHADLIKDGWEIRQPGKDGLFDAERKSIYGEIDLEDY